MRQLILIPFLLFYSLQIFSQHSDIFCELQENVWYLPTKDQKAKLYMTSLGQGDTIITLHGGPGNNFNYLVKAIKNNRHNNHFILFDQRGSILSPVKDAVKQDLTIDKLVGDVETIRKSLNKDKITIFGHSFGTLLALFYYQKYPQHVEKLVLTASMAPCLTENEPFSVKLQQIHKRIKDLRERPEVKKELIKAGLDGNTLTPKQESLKYKITGLASFNMHNISKWKHFIGGGVYYNPDTDSAIGSSIPKIYDIRPVLKKYPVPISIIQGDQDYIDPEAKDWNSLKKEYKNIEIMVIGNASHHPWLDNQQLFDRYLSRALN